MPKAVAEKDLIQGCGGKETSSLYQGAGGRIGIYTTDFVRNFEHRRCK